MSGHSLYVLLWSCFSYQIFLRLLVKYFTLGNSLSFVNHSFKKKKEKILSKAKNWS